MRRPLATAAATLRFLARFARPAAGGDPAIEREVLLEAGEPGADSEGGGEPRHAVLFVPRGHPTRAADTILARCPPGPHGFAAWVLLPGITVPGRHHQGVRRIGSALAAAGHVALAPEVPPWTALRVDPQQTTPAIRAALTYFDADPAVDPERLGLMAFSVAGTWALQAAAEAGDLRRRLPTLVSLGGYGDLERLLVAMVVGEHEWRGRTHRYTPDPYGRWIMGADLLPRLEDDAYGSEEERERCAAALRRLAVAAGRNGASSNASVYDPLIAALRETVPAEALPAWDLLAPPSQRPVPDAAAGRALAGALAQAGLRRLPHLNPAGRLDGLAGSRGRTGHRNRHRDGPPRVFLLHGRQDTLVPFTETLRLATLLPRGPRRSVTITQLVGHAKATQMLQLARNPAALTGEVLRFAFTMARIIASVDRR